MQEISKRGAEPGLDRPTTGGQHTPGRIRQISQQLGGKPLIGVDARRDGHADQSILVVHRASSHDLPVAAPRPNLLGQGRPAEPPGPAQVARMQLNRHTVLLPERHRLDDLIQRLRLRVLQLDRHALIQPDTTATAHLV